MFKEKVSLSKRKRRDLMIVIFFGVIFLGLAGYLIYYYKTEIDTNYYYFPSEDSPFYGQRIVFLALDKDYGGKDHAVAIYYSNGTFVTIAPLFLWGISEHKYIHCANFSTWTPQPSDYNATFRFMFTYRTWYSEPFMLHEEKAFIWCSKTNISYDC